LKDKKRVDGRPGKDMPPLDFIDLKSKLEKKYQSPLRDVDVMSHVQFPAVFDDYMSHLKKYGNVTALPTREFLEPMAIGEKVSFSTFGKKFDVTLDDVKDLTKDGISTVTVDINGEKLQINVTAKQPTQPPFIKRKSGATVAPTEQQEARKKADKSKPGSVGAPLPGKVIDVKAGPGQDVKKGDPIVVLSAMKLEITVTAPMSGKITAMYVTKTDTVAAADLLFEMQ